MARLGRVLSQEMRRIILGPAWGVLGGGQRVHVENIYFVLFLSLEGIAQRGFSKASTLQLETARVLQRAVFALPSCRQMSVNTHTHNCMILWGCLNILVAACHSSKQGVCQCPRHKSWRCLQFLDCDPVCLVQTPFRASGPKWEKIGKILVLDSKENRKK